MDFIQEEREDFRNIFYRFKKRDFSGLGGQAMKNSGYEFATNIVMKVGSLFFTIIIARMLMPELFGLYSLALGTIILVASLSDLGIGSAAMTFLSRKLSKKRDSSEAKKYFKTLLKWKIYASLIGALIIVLLSYYLANTYYNKPIFFALLAGGLYIPVVTLTNFLSVSFKADNNFKYPLLKEIFLQVLKLTIVPLGILIIFKMDLETNSIIFFVLLTIILCYLLSFFLLIYFMKRKVPFLKAKAKELDKDEKKGLRRFILPLTAIILSGAFFGYIDMFMLGHYVSSIFLSYYSVSFVLVGAVTVLVGSVATGLFPIFSRIKGPVLKNLLRKSKNMAFIISFFIAIFTVFAAYWIVKIVYGPSFLPATLFLQFFSILIILSPIIAIYTSYYISQRKTSSLAVILIGSTIITIILNFIGINYGLQFGEYYGVLGACIATIVSKIICLSGMILWSKK